MARRRQKQAQPQTAAPTTEAETAPAAQPRFRRGEIPTDYTANVRDLRRIFVLASVMTAILIALTFVLR